MPSHGKSPHVDLAYKAYPDTPIPEGHRLEIPFRDPRVPIFWEVERHPKLPADAVVEKCLVFWQNTNPVIMRALHKYLKSVKIPEGTADKMHVAGHLIVKTHWYIFIRDVHGSGKPEDDLLQMWTLDKKGMPALVPAKFHEMRDRNLGRKSRRTPNKPWKVKRVFTREGIEWERHALTKSIEKNERAYSLTLSFEQQCNLVRPCAGTKIQDDITDHNKMRAETVTAAANVGMCALDATPSELKEAADLQANLLNIALVGNTRNTAFPFMQMNVVSTQPAGQEDKKIKQELGKFGGKHIDGHDLDAGVTCMIMDSNIDEEMEDWGYFVICDLGIAVELRGFCVICFCGLRYHGGFAPTAKQGHAPKPWSYRYTIVLYPSASLIEGTSRVAYAALSKNSEFPLVPEMILPREDDQSTRVNHATWLHEGALFTPVTIFLLGAEPCDEGLEVHAASDGSEGDPQQSLQVRRISGPGLGDDHASWCGNG